MNNSKDIRICTLPLCGRVYAVAFNLVADRLFVSFGEMHGPLFVGEMPVAVNRHELDALGIWTGSAWDEDRLNRLAADIIHECVAGNSENAELN